MQQLRLYHLLLATMVLAAYFTGDAHRLHPWLGYGVAAVLLLRVGLALSGKPQLGLMRFYPHFNGLKLGSALTHPAVSRSLLLAILLCTLGTVGTGIWMDQGQTLGLGGPSPERARSEIQQAAALGQDDAHHDEESDDSEDRRSGRSLRSGGEGSDEQEGEGVGHDALEEVHEVLANLLLAIVAVHVTYLILFKRPLARFMMFLPKAKRR